MLPAVLAIAVQSSLPIAYVAEGRLAVKNVPGAKVPVIRNVREPTLSPDAKKVLYWISPSDSLECPVIELDLMSGKTRTVAKGNCRSPGYSVDGKSIFFTRYAKDWTLYTVPATALSPVKELIGTGVFMPVRSPGNPWIVTQDMKNVYWVKPDGERVSTIEIGSLVTDETLVSSATTFADKPGDMGVIAISQDAEGSDKRVIDEHTGMVSAIYIFDATLTRRRITPKTISAGLPRWSKDAQWIYFRGSGAVGGKGKVLHGVWRIRPSGKDLSLIVPGADEFSI